MDWVVHRNHQAQPEVTRGEVLARIEGLVNAGVADVQVRGMPRLMARAKLGVEAAGHYGLNLSAYTWFTSPLRRYADLVNQRMLEAHLEGRPAPYDAGSLAPIAEAINERQDELLDKRSAGFRASVERQAEAMIDSGAIATDLDFRRVVRVASADPAKVNDVVIEVSLRRIGRGELSAKELARLLLLDPRTGAAVVAYLGANPHEAPNVLNYGIASMGWGQPAFEEGRTGPAHATVFVAKGRMEVDGVEHVSPTVVGPSRKGAQHSATVHLLASVAGQRMPVESEAPAEAADAAPEVDRAPVSAQNPRNRLQEYCA